MDRVVYGRASSSNVQAVMWGLAELGLTARRVDVGGEFGGLDAPAFRLLNPHGRIPVLQDGRAAPLFESGAILRYLCNRYGAAPFWPGDPVARAHVDAWAEWAKHDFGARFTVPVFWAPWRTPKAQRDVAGIRAAIAAFEDQMRVLGPRLDGGGWVAGADFSPADIWAGHVLCRYFTLDIDRKAPAALVDYYERLTQRPAYRAHVMLDYEDLKGKLT